MQKNYIFLIIVMVFTIIFAYQNMSVMNINLLFWKFEASAFVILIIAFVLGGLSGLLVSMPMYFKHRKEVNKLQKQIAHLSEEKKKLELSQKTSAPDINRPEDKQ